jgi:hypothetical protein
MWVPRHLGFVYPATIRRHVELVIPVCAYSLSRGVQNLNWIFSMATSGFNMATSGFNMATSGFKIATSGFNIATSSFNIATSGFNMATSAFNMAT